MSTENNEPLLSLEETNALLEAMRSGAEGSAEVEGADLASPERPLRSALDRADASARAMAHAIDKLMIRWTGCSTSSEEQPAEIMPYKVIRGSIAQASGVTTLRSNDGSMGLLVLSPALVAFLLDRRMGAPLGSGNSEARIELSPLDRRLLKPMMDSLAEILGQHWCDDPMAFTAGDVYADAADVPMMAQFEPMLQIGLRVAAPGLPGDELAFALSVGAVRASIPKKHTVGPSASAADRRRMLECVRDSRVRCTAVLGQTNSTVGHLLVLQAGDLLRLDGAPDQAIDVRVGDATVLAGKPVLQHGNLAVQVSQVPGQ
ncbi:MAG: FliM/FliN family flagellar motor switch protein [Myxococcales bacterium]|nr:FliM/FliN family flagellar motor switch protein [Myxococcales bacterium]MDD9965692.1 FliM/FliN family flagellar motor switch protein [Myxococcales bacterium]